MLNRTALFLPSLFLLAACGGGSSTPAPAPAPTEELRNNLTDGSIENNNLSWNMSGTASITDQNAQDGNKAAFIDGNGRVFQNVSLQRNTEYTLTVWGKVAEDTQSFWVGVSSVQDAGVTFIQNTEFTTTDYVQKTIRFQTDSNDTYQIWMWNNAGGQYYTDNYVLTTPADFVVPDPVPSFENVIASEWQYIERLSDEFNTASINAAKWDNDVADWGPWSWEPTNTAQANGLLSLTIDHDPHVREINGSSRQLYYTSGIYRARTTHTYGYYEARIKGTPTFPGSSPAFWIYSIGSDRTAAGMDPVENGDPIYTEVDFVEMQQREWSTITGVGQRDDERVLDMNLHAIYRDDTQPNNQREVRPHNDLSHLSQNKMRADFDPREDFHIYGTEVTPTEINWYLDGVKVFTKANLYWHLPMRVTLSLGLRYPLVTYTCSGSYAGLNRCPVPEETTEVGYPNDMEIDWVRVYNKK